MSNLQTGGDSGPSASAILLKSTIMAAVLAVPSIGIFLGIYFGTGDLLIGAVAGFGTHFVILAFAGRISRRLVDVGRGGNKQ